MRPNRERFLPYALEGVRAAPRGAGGVAPHRREPLGGAGGRAVPAGADRGWARPGVDVHTFRPGTADLEGLADAAGVGRGAPRGAGSAGAAEALRSLDPDARPDRELRGQADRVEGRRPAAGGLAARGGAGAGGAARDRRVRHLPRGARPVRGGAAAARPRRPARHRGARARARGRPAGRAEAPDEPSSIARTASGWQAAPGGRRPGPLHRPARARRPARPAAGLRGAGDAEHLPRGVRDGRGRGGRVRRAAAVRPATPGWPR